MGLIDGRCCRCCCCFGCRCSFRFMAKLQQCLVSLPCLLLSHFPSAHFPVPSIFQVKFLPRCLIKNARRMLNNSLWIEIHNTHFVAAFECCTGNESEPTPRATQLSQSAVSAIFQSQPSHPNHPPHHPTLTHPNLEPDGGLIVFHILGPHNFLASEERPAKDFLMCAHKI